MLVGRDLFVSVLFLWQVLCLSLFVFARLFVRSFVVSLVCLSLCLSTCLFCLPLAGKYTQHAIVRFLVWWLCLEAQSTVLGLCVKTQIVSLLKQKQTKHQACVPSFPSPSPTEKETHTKKHEHKQNNEKRTTNKQTDRQTHTHRNTHKTTNKQTRKTKQTTKQTTTDTDIQTKTCIQPTHTYTNKQIHRSNKH